MNYKMHRDTASGRKFILHRLSNRHFRESFEKTFRGRQPIRGYGKSKIWKQEPRHMGDFLGMPTKDACRREFLKGVF